MVITHDHKKKSTQVAPDVVPAPEPETTPETTELEQLRTQLEGCQERERRAQADYQNLLRRTHEDKARLIALANADLLTELLQPLDHLELAAAQLKDAGLQMVVAQFKNTLTQFGLEPIEVMGQPYDVETMEVVERQSDSAQKVIKVVATGYRLNGRVLRHAKVVVG